VIVLPTSRSVSQTIAREWNISSIVLSVMTALFRFCDKNPLFDWYFLFGAFAMCEDGLYHNQHQINNNLRNKVFPNLHSIHNNTVTNKITNAIRDNLTPLDKKEQHKYSAKSLRCAAITELSMHKEINIYSANACTGHSTGTSNDSYLDKKNPARGLPAAHALHGRKDLYTEVVLPKLKALGEPNQGKVQELVSAMFHSVNIPDFEVGGRHRVILEISAASLLQHYCTASTIGNN